MKQDEIENLLKPTIENMGYALWGLEYIAQGRHSLLRIYIDKEAGIGIEDCERVSKQVSALLDVEDPIAAHYSLEVSSPGIPKPLFHDWQYQLYIGHEVTIRLLKPIAGQRKFTGKIISCEGDVLMLGIDQQQHEFSITTITKANLTDE